MCQPDSGEMALEVVDQLVRSSSLDIIAIDSVAALTPRAEIEGEIGNVTRSSPLWQQMTCCMPEGSDTLVNSHAGDCRVWIGLSMHTAHLRFLKQRWPVLLCSRCASTPAGAGAEEDLWQCLQVQRDDHLHQPAQAQGNPLRMTSVNDSVWHGLYASQINGHLLLEVITHRRSRSWLLS